MSSIFSGFYKTALGSLQSTFGETVEFRPKNGSPVEVRGIFNEMFTAIDSDSGFPLTTQKPNLGINLKDFNAPPGPGDEFSLRGMVYEFADIHRDGEGHATVLLHNGRQQDFEEG